MATYFPQTLIFYGGGGALMLFLEPKPILPSYKIYFKRPYFYYFYLLFLFLHISAYVLHHVTVIRQTFLFLIVIILIISSHTIMTILTF